MTVEALRNLVEITPPLFHSLALGALVVVLVEYVLTDVRPVSGTSLLRWFVIAARRIACGLPIDGYFTD